jgi:hypothetical protein
MEIIIAPIALIIVFIICYTMPETEVEAQAVENRRLRKQRQRGNYDATPRTSPRKEVSYPLTFQSAYKEYTYSQKRKLAEDIFDVVNSQSKIKLNEAHVLWKKDVIGEIKEVIAGLDSDGYGYEMYIEMLSESKAELKMIEKNINN